MARVYRRNELQPVPQTEQIELNIQPTFEQLIADTRYRLKARQQELELQPFWKSIEPIMAIISSAVVAAMVFFGAIANFSKLPPEIPVFFDATIETWRNADVSFLFILPFIYLVLITFLMRAISYVFTFDRKLATLACGLIIFLNLATIFAVAQIANIFNILN